MDLRLLFIASVTIGFVCSAPLGMDTRMREGLYSVDFGYEPSVHDVIVSDQFGYEPRIPVGYHPLPVGFYPNFHETQYLHRVPVEAFPSKGLFTGMTQFIGSMFPIEVNVPDLFSAMWNSLPRPFANRRPFANPFASTQAPRIH